MPATLFDAQERTEVRLLIAFIDFTRYTARVIKTPPLALAEIIDEYYHRVAAAVAAAGGKVVKYIGDGSLIVFPLDRADAGVLSLLDLKRDVDAGFRELGWDSRLVVKVHAGEVVAGPFGPERRFDVIGREVNVAATLATRGFALSAEAFRSLASETRTRFKKHTPPITYIRTEDPHPHRTGRIV